MGLGRAIGACIPAAAAAAVAGGLALLLGLLVMAQLGNPGVGFDGPASQQITSAYNGLILWAVLSFLMGFLPALVGAFVVLLPLHFVLLRTGRTQLVWYLAAGCAAGVLAILLTRQIFGYLDWWAQTEGLSGLLIAAALGGPVGGLVYRRIVLRAPALG